MAVAGRITTRETTRERLGTRPGVALWAVVAFATLLGAVMRVLPAWSSDFPLNDGGMFSLMAGEVQQHRYRLPSFTAYNDAGIPFAYPPLGLYLAALLGDITGRSAIDIVRRLPPILALLTIPAYALLGGVMLRPRTRVIIAVFAFALLPRATTWLIMGGGLTRAPGALFAILALWQLHQLYVRGERRFVPPAIVFGGLTVLAHAEWAWFTTYSAALFFLFLGCNRRGAANSILVAAGVAAFSAPWWATVIARHGLDPLVAAAQSGGRTASGGIALVTFQFTAEPFLPILGVLGLIGIFACLADGAYLIPAWLVAILILQPRSAPTLATLPLALLIGITLDRVILPALQDGRSERPHLGEESAAAKVPGYLRARTPRLFAAYCLLYALVCAASLPYTQPALHVLPRAERDAMGWVAANTAPESTFLVLPDLGPTAGWWEDHTSEWFPMLARRASLGTVQGSEWLPNGAFTRDGRRAHALRGCADGDGTCLESWAREGDVAFTHVYLAGARGDGRNERLLRSLLSSRDYRLVYEGPGATVFATVARP